jgi:rubrerythrin
MNKFKKSLELNKLFIKNTSPDELESLMAEFDKYEVDVELVETNVSKWICKHCGNKLCDSQTFNQQCFNCGKKPL